MTDFELKLRETLVGPEPLMALRALLEAELQRGITSEELLIQLEKLRADLTETEDDLVLVTMDWLTGWCSPHERLGT